MITPENKLKPRIILAITSVLIPLVVDQATKLLAIYFLMDQPSVSLIPGILQLHYIENTGAAWGMFQDKTLWLALLSLAALGITTSLVIQALRHGTVLEIIAFSVLTGGIIGNAIDRVFRGAVVDFIDMYFKKWHWPTYNIADIAITGGVTLIVLHFCFRKPEAEQ
jgi:signal peptidase II